jgi:hypothetical protein
MPKPKSDHLAVVEVETDAEVLSASEANRLRHCEKDLEHFRENYYKAGEALKVIRDQRLYRQTHKTFELYLEERWGMSRGWAHELIGTSEVMKTLSGIPNIPPPANQSQAVELTILKESEDRVWAWKKVVATTPPEEITAKRVAAIVKERREKVASKKKPVSAAPEPSPKAVERALSHIESMTDKKCRALVTGSMTPPEIVALSKLGDYELREVGKLLQKGWGWAVAVQEVKGRLQPGDEIRDIHTKVVQGDGWYEGTVGSFYHVCVDEKTKEAMESKFPGWPSMRTRK